MFDLEQSISDWRRRMLAAGIKAPMPLDELESHLREDIEQQMKAGLAAQQAFHAATEKIGQANALKTEFKKADGFGTFMKTKLINKLTVATSVVLLLSFLMSAPTLFVYRIMVAAPNSEKELARLEATKNIGELKTSVLSLITFRDESLQFVAAVCMVILTVQAVVFISSCVSLFWLRRLKGTHDA